jgi:hypothetical protein
MSELILTKGQSQTISRLKSSSWDVIRPGDITRLLPKLLDSKPKSEELIPKIVEYERIKNPSKSIQWIEKVLDKKLKAPADKTMLREVLAQGDYSSFPDVTKPSKRTVTESLPSSFPDVTKSKKKSGTDAKLQETLDKILGGSVKETPFQGKGTAADAKPMDWGSLFKTGSKTYTDNKAMIDKFKASITPEKMADGSWFTSLAAMEAPEIEILQKVINMTPLGLSTKDKSNLENLLSRDKTKSGSVSTSDGVKLILKTLINPDAVGTILKTRGEQISADAAEGLDTWWRKATGAAPKKDEKLGALEDIIKARQDDKGIVAKRQSDIDALKGKVPPTIPVKEADKGIVGLKPGFIVDKFKPVNGAEVDLNKLSIEDILKPPPIPGQTTTTATQDAFGFLKGIFVPTYGLGDKRNTPEGALEWLRTNDPAAYSKYNQAKAANDRTVKKAGLSLNSEIDLSVSKEEVLRARTFTQDLLKKASSLKQLSDQEIEDIYDISATLEEVLTGKTKISYKQLDDITRSIINQVPKSVLDEANLAGFLRDQSARLKDQFNGDSSLTKLKEMTEGKYGRDADDTKPDDTDTDTKPDDPKPDPKQPPGIPDTQPINESKLDDNDEDTSWSELRPRMEWGGTDAMFTRSKENVNLGNLLSDARSVEKPGWGNGTDNILFMRNNEVDRRRFTNTFPMPQTQRYMASPNFYNNNSAFGQTQYIDAYCPQMDQPYVPTFQPWREPAAELNAYLARIEPIWEPQLPPAGIERPLVMETRNPASFNQFLEFTPAYDPTSYRMTNSAVQYAYYPDVQNLAFQRGREPLAAYPLNSMEFIRNQRFTK